MFVNSSDKNQQRVVSNTSVLSSKAMEKHLNVFAVFNKFSCKLAAMASILRTLVYLDIGIASIFDIISGHNMLIASTMQSFTNSASEKSLQSSVPKQNLPLKQPLG